MEKAAPDVKISEALSAIGQYFSDMIPPVQAVEPLTIMLKQPAQLMVSEIVNWMPARHEGNDTSASVADYLFHAVSKLYYLAHLQLISKQALTPYLDSVKQLLLDYCPPENRQLLLENFNHLGMSETAMAAPIGFIYRQMRSGGSESEVPEVQRSEQPINRRLSILRNRLRSMVRQPGLPARNESREDLVPHLIATAAADFQSVDEFRDFQEDLRSLEMDAGTDQIFRTLSHSLPGWMIAAASVDVVRSNNPAIQAMCNIVHLAGNSYESFKRFQDMVYAAIEQFNTGSLARAATMFDLALGIDSDNKLDPDAVTRVRKTAHELLDLNRLRSLAKESGKHRLLRKILNFFDEFSVKNILNNLQTEEKRDRRRLLLDLLETHGGEARKMAFERLKELTAAAELPTDWYFARNLVCILNKIAPVGDVPPKMEAELIAPLFQLSMPVPLVKEAIRLAGQIKCEESEELLVSFADRLEKVAFESAASGKDPTRWLSLLDRTIFALAHYGSPKGYGRVVKHGISRHREFGDTAARLAYLSGQDLTSDQESLALLIQFLKSNTPHKLLGVTIRKHYEPVIHAIRALSSTPAPAVRQAFEDLAAQFPETEYGQAADIALKEFEASDKSGIPAERVLTGDLDLFGLPDLLQQLNLLQVAGTLTLKDAKGNLIGTLSLIAGRLHDCSAGRLRGEEAAYQLLEKPIAGTFVFHGQRNAGVQHRAEEEGIPELNSILSEGMRRYNELQCARALVPDFALLRQKGPEPIWRPDEEDSDLFNLLWQKTAAGASPEECEAAYPADSYRIRVLLARWVEEGVLTVE
jgi:hypothetical protein